MINDILVRHALRNAWCSPRQDLQYVIKPARLTRASGIRHSFTYGWTTTDLPSSKDVYHLYQIGQIEPSMLGLTQGRQVWRTLDKVMEKELLIADVYTLDGRMLERAKCWVIYTEERNLLVAIRNQPKIVDMEKAEVFIRFYSNAYFNSLRANGQQEVLCRSVKVETLADAATFQTGINLLAAKPGAVRVYHNGLFVDRIVLSSVKPNDILEYVYDGSHKQIIDLRVTGLPVFKSELDKRLKYILHSSGAQVQGPVIDYHDDIDIYLYKVQQDDPQKGFIGCYYNKNNRDSMRQLTHRDYSIPTEYVERYTDDHDWDNTDDIVLRLYVRHSGYQRPLIYEHNRLQELYKLSDLQILQALHGTGSNVDVWKAVNLEQSAYIKLMGSLEHEIDRPLVEEAYGYNAISRLMGNGPLKVELVNGRRQVTLPFGFWQNSTMFEFDAQGQLIESYYHPSGPEYTPNHPDCELVEGVVGKGAYQVSSWFGFDPLTIKPKHNYRFYLTNYVSGQPNPTGWVDVTGDSTKYQIVGNQVVWMIDQNQYYACVRSDEIFLLYELEISSHNSLIRFSIDEGAGHPTSAAHGMFGIPPGKLDLWLNGHSLIENLDYFVEWPQVVVCNKKFTQGTTTHKIVIRGTGFCEPDLTRRPPAEIGYVQHGLLSRNNRFNLRDDKVIRLVMNGATHHRSILEYAEDHAGVYVTAIPDGSPYVIENVVVPLPELEGRDDYAYLEQARSIDHQIEDYLTLKLPQPPIPQPVIIPDKYELYSPFASTILHDIINGIISMDPFKGQFSDQSIKVRLKEYEWLLEYDPVFKALDRRYVNVHPHNQYHTIPLDLYQHRFFSRAVRLYLNDGVDLAIFIVITPP